MTPEEIHAAKEKYLDEAEKALEKRLSEIESKLAAKVQDLINQEYAAGERSSLLNIQKKFAKLFDDWVSKDGIKIARDIIKSNNEIADFNKRYFTSLNLDKEIIEQVNTNTNRLISEMFGYTTNDGVIELVRDGFLDQVIKGGEIRSQITKELSLSWGNGANFEDVVTNIGGIIQGSADNLGLVRQHYRTYAYDAFQRKDRIETNEYSKELGLQAAIYGGTVIKASRSFCKSKTGKTFTRDEMQKWKDDEWSGKNEPYVPERDLGGYNCRHNLRWISAQEALRRRPDLKLNESGKLVAA